MSDFVNIIKFDIFPWISYRISRSASLIVNRLKLYPNEFKKTKNLHLLTLVTSGTFDLENIVLRNVLGLSINAYHITIYL